eukprot:354050-Chlamydomonas_euryale.AAC.2
MHNTHGRFHGFGVLTICLLASACVPASGYEIPVRLCRLENIQAICWTDGGHMLWGITHPYDDWDGWHPPPLPCIALMATHRRVAGRGAGDASRTPRGTARRSLPPYTSALWAMHGGGCSSGDGCYGGGGGGGRRWLA